MKGNDASREIMIREHLVRRGISDEAVLKAMRDVPREAFVPEKLMEFAFGDYPLSIEEGQTISQPYIVALMAESLELNGDDRVLDIGTGSGYAAAIISKIAADVYTVEHFPTLARSAADRLKRLRYDNIHVHVGDGTLGWPEFAPYNAIQVTAGAPHVPEALLQQLAVGGRLVIPVGNHPRMQMLVRVRRLSEGEYQTEDLCAVQFVPLIGRDGWNDSW